MRGAAMAYKEVLRVEISEVIRRWRQVTARDASPRGQGCPGIPSPDTSLRRWRWACPVRGRSSARSSSVGWRPSGSWAPAGGDAQRGIAGPVGRPDPPVAYRRPAAADAHPGVAGGAELPGIVCLPAALRGPPPLAKAHQVHGAHGRDAAW